MDVVSIAIKLITIVICLIFCICIFKPKKWRLLTFYISGIISLFYSIGLNAQVMCACGFEQILLDISYSCVLFLLALGLMSIITVIVDVVKK